MMQYLAALLLVAGPIALFGRDTMARVGAILILNWVLGYLYNEVNHTFTPWAWSLLIDTVSAALILLRPAGKWQAGIGATYVAQIICHFVFASSERALSPHEYWSVLTGIAWGQLAILFAWGATDVAYRHLRRDPGNLVASHRGGLEKGR